MHKNYQKIFYILFTILILLYLAGNIYWIHNNYSIKGQTVPNHLLFSLEIFYKCTDIVHEPNIWNKICESIKLITQPVHHAAIYVPNFTYLPTILFYTIFGETLFAAKISNYVYLLVLAISIFLLTKDISSDFTGFVSVFLVLMYPLIFESLRQYGPDLPLTAMTTLTFLLFLRCKNFSNSKYSVALGCIVGIGMLVKGQLLLFIITPLLYSIYITVKRKKVTKKYLFNVVMFIIIANSIASLWWGTHFAAAVESFRWHIFETKSVVVRSYLHIFYNQMKMLIFSSIGLPLFIFLFPGIYLLIRNRKTEKAILLIWIIIPILIAIFMSLETYQKYLLPVLPAIAIVTSWGIFKIKSKKIVITLLILLAFSASFQFYRLTFSDIKSTPNAISLWGGTRFGDIKHKKDIYEINTVLKKIQQQRVPNRKVNILTILLTPGPPLPFELRYWARVAGREWNLLDAGAMFTTAYHEFNFFDFIVLRLPDNKTFNDWPTIEKFADIIKQCAEPYPRYLLSRSATPKKLYKRIYEDLSNYRFIEEINTNIGYIWFVYKKEQNYTD